MRVSVTELFPDDWTISVQVINGGKDRMGDPLPNSTVTVDKCVLSYGMDTLDFADNSQVPTDQPTLFMPIGTPITSTSKVRVPDTDISVGSLYVVDGEIGRTPLGIRVRLRKG